MWREWVRRPEWSHLHNFDAHDIGVDLVAQQTEAWGGGLCAIQAKLYDSSTVDKRAVDSFLAASDSALFTDRILIATAALNVNAKRVLTNASPRCHLLQRADLENWEVTWADYFDEPKQLRFKPVRYTPHPFQAEAVDAVVEGFFDDDRGKLILPCGTGKSVVALWIAEAEEVAGRGGTVLYLVPSIALMGQTMREWARQRDPQIPHRYVGVCSDTRAGRNDEDADLTELAMPVTTDLHKITSELSGSHPDAMTVVFCTYQSLELIEQAQALGAHAFDIAICDEAHRTTGIHETGNGSAFTLIHEDTRIWADRRLFMTATPRVYAEAVKRRAGERARDLGVSSMDDKCLYGPEFYRMGFGEAVEAGHLADYQVLVIAVAENPVFEPYEQVKSAHVDLPRGQQIILEEAVKFAGCWDALADPTTRTAQGRITGLENPDHACRRAIAFTNTIRSSKKVAKFWGDVISAMSRTRTAGGSDEAALGDTDVGLLNCEVKHVDGTKNALERANTIEWLKQGDEGGCRMVTNAKCLTEGVDVPALDAVLFLEPKKSQIDVVQAVGRVMRRPHAGKTLGYVVLPVVVPTGKGLTDDEVLKGSDFKQVWSVLKALRSHDERLDFKINTADLGGKLPLRILTSAGLCDRCGRSDCEGCASGGESAASIGDHVQPELPFESAIASRMVEVCGDRRYWDRWGKEVAKITGHIVARISTMLRSNDGLQAAFDAFCKAMRATIGGTQSDSELITMVAQHIVTLPVFDALFSDSGFADRNPISKAFNELLDEFKALDFNPREETRDLERFYDSVKNRLSGASDSEARLKVMLEVYETFFKEAMPDAVQRLGIVYTPVELVDFMLRSVDAVLKAEFGKGIGAPNVHVLDPFTGTGTFINRLLTQNGSDGTPLIADADLRRKFCGTEAAPAEIHANEIVLLAYYLAAIKIEEGFKERTGEYEPFEGIVLTDTFMMGEDGRLPGTGPLAHNSDRAKRQNDLPIQVIIGNPPWSAGQKSAGDDNPNISYPHVERRVAETYGRRHREVTGRGAGKSAGNLYVEAFRWATDRLAGTPGGVEGPGVVAFVHPNSLSNGTSLAGMRASLRDEFTAIYVINLRGDAYKSGSEFRKEGEKIFGGGSRNGVQITVLVRNPSQAQRKLTQCRYAGVPEHSTLQAKFSWLAELGDVKCERLGVVPINAQHDWVNLTDGSFLDLLRVCDTNTANPQVALQHHALGITTACDQYVYSFSRAELTHRIRRLAEAYTESLELYEAGCTLDEVTANDNLGMIKWTAAMKQALKRHEEIEFDESRVREVLYRPFTKLWLYEDDRILSSVKTISAMFPRDGTETPPLRSLPPRRTTETSSQFSRSTQSRISTRWDPTKVGPEQSHAESDDPHHGNVEHDLSGARHHDDSRPGSNQGLTADSSPSPPPDDAMRPPRRLSSSPLPTIEHSSEPSSQTAHQTCAPPERTNPPEQFAGGDPDGGAFEHGRVRGAGDGGDAGPAHHGAGSADAVRGAGIIVTSPTNRTRFGVLATPRLPDLHSLDPAARAVSRYQK